MWNTVRRFKNDGIATLLTTQYLEEADALSDRIIVVDRGAVVAEGTAHELKTQTGGSYCEVIPEDQEDLDGMVAVLRGLVPKDAALTVNDGRVVMPALDGARTLVQVLRRLDLANIEVMDAVLRRPSLDDVFLSLTKDSPR